MCSSTSGAHVTAAVYVPEANRGAGCGPAIATVHVRSVSISLAELLAHDLRGALRVANFRVLVSLPLSPFIFDHALVCIGAFLVYPIFHILLLAGAALNDSVFNPLSKFCPRRNPMTKQT